MLFKLLLNRRLPQGIASLTTVQHSAELQWAKDKIKVLHPPLDYVDIYFAFSRQSATTPEFVAKFDQALRRYKSSAAYTALLQRYQLY